MSDDDPVSTNPGLYEVLFENDLVRVLSYTDEPGTRSEPHTHPNSVMVTLSAFRRRLSSGDVSRDVALPAGAAVWLPAQRHFGENIGDTTTRSVFVELKGPAAGTTAGGLGPAAP